MSRRKGRKVVGPASLAVPCSRPTTRSMTGPTGRRLPKESARETGISGFVPGRLRCRQDLPTAQMPQSPPPATWFLLTTVTALAAPATRPVVPRGRIRLCRLPAASPTGYHEGGGYVRPMALDVHRDFCEVAVKEGGEHRSAGRVKTTVASASCSRGASAQTTRGRSRRRDPGRDRGHPRAARRPGGSREARRVRAIAEAKLKPDKVDARTLCELLDAGFLPATWNLEEQTRALRGLLGRRERLVRSRTRAKDSVHAALQRELKRRPPMSDLFGGEGRAWLGQLGLPSRERRIVDSYLSAVDFLSQRDRGARVGAHPAGARLRANQAAHDGARGQPRLGGDVRGGRWRYPPLRNAEEAGRLRRPRPKGAPVERADRPPWADLEAGLRCGASRALRGGLDRGPHARPPCAPSTSACERRRGRRSPPS
jgi:Transposase